MSNPTKKVEASITVNTTPEEVISAFIEPEKLKDWWGVEKTLIEKKEDGVYTLAWMISEHGMKYVSTGFIKSYQPAKELIVENFVYLNPEKPFLGPMSLTVRAAQNEDASTEVYLCQDGYREGANWEWYYEAVKQAWPAVLQDLKKYLEKREKH